MVCVYADLPKLKVSKLILLRLKQTSDVVNLIQIIKNKSLLKFTTKNLQHPTSIGLYISSNFFVSCGIIPSIRVLWYRSKYLHCIASLISNTNCLNRETLGSSFSCALVKSLADLSISFHRFSRDPLLRLKLDQSEHCPPVLFDFLEE